MDSLYIGDIPLDFHYATFEDNGDIVLRDRQVYNEPGNYKVYTLKKNNQNKFIYSLYYQVVQTGQVIDKPGLDIKVSNYWYDRPDCFNILFFTLCVCLGSIFIINIFTSIFKKGGLLGGLL